MQILSRIVSEERNRGSELWGVSAPPSRCVVVTRPGLSSRGTIQFLGFESRAVIHDRLQCVVEVSYHILGENFLPLRLSLIQNATVMATHRVDEIWLRVDALRCIGCKCARNIDHVWAGRAEHHRWGRHQRHRVWNSGSSRHIDDLVWAHLDAEWDKDGIDGGLGRFQQCDVAKRLLAVVAYDVRLPIDVESLW
ncbi:hypothetical protein GALL_454900 [mine drainage metagenome]|uniref:Uncharacterized protein n=1 Tax=mine drainage metagenome TaxID=410659 RepID=A0A1J5PMZ7_9ZZZZ